MMDVARECWFLTGPTASGKTAVGLALAARLGAEIISLDSMAVYRGMDIGTAKPTPDERLAVPHHLIDLRHPQEDFSLSEYVELAHQKSEEIRGRGREVLFVGGTPLYLKSLLRGLCELAPPNEALRQQLAEEASQHAENWLHRQLEQVDPISAARLHPNDHRRIIRALEVHRHGGRPLGELQQQFDRPVARHECRVFLLDWPREVLYERINRRVEEMFEDGLVEEVQRITVAGSLGRTAAQAVGYREVLQHFTGKLDLPECIQLIQQHTRQFAKRQLTWFRGLSECRPAPMSEKVEVGAICDEILAKACEE